MGEFGVYDVLLSPLEKETASCSFQMAKEPVDIYARKSNTYMCMLR